MSRIKIARIERKGIQMNDAMLAETMLMGCAAVGTAFATIATLLIVCIIMEKKK